MKEHGFTVTIRRILSEHFLEYSKPILDKSEVLQYINIKSVSATKGSKARGSFGNLYALYVLVEDYLNRNFHESGDYQNAEGAKFVNL